MTLLFISPTSIHVFSLAIITGMTLHTTFLNGFIQFKHLPRQQFGNLQARQFPPYFTIQTVCSALLLLTTGAILSNTTNNNKTWKYAIEEILSRLLQPSSFDNWQILLWTLSLITSATNLIWIGPASTRNMYERHKLEKEGLEGSKQQLQKHFAILHGISSLANLITVIASITNCYWLSIYFEKAKTK